MVDLPSVLASDPLWLVLSAVSAVILTLVIQNYLDRPKLTGNILNSVSFTAGVNPHDVRGEMTLFVILPYVYLTNQHRNSVSLVDFKFDIDVGKGWVRLERYFSDDAFWKDKFPSMVAIDLGDRIVRFQDAKKALLETKLKPVGFGDYLHGFIPFAFKNPTFYGKDIKGMRLTCLDVFGKEHTINQYQKDKFPFYIFERDAGIVSEWKKS